MNKRIIGIDVARSLAVIGMILVNFKMVFGKEGAPWLTAVSGVFDGKAAATFVVLAGVGLAFMTNRASREGDLEKLKTARKRILKRAIFLFVVGLTYLSIWPADILHFYGIYRLLTIFFINRKGKFILAMALSLIFLFPVMLFVFDYELGWNFDTFEYSGFWTPEGFVRNLFYNGFHPAIPWAAFMLVGLWLGKQDLSDLRFVKRAFSVSLISFLVLQAFSSLAMSAISPDKPAHVDMSFFFSTSPMPPLPVYMLTGSSIAIVIISGCILLTESFPKLRLFDMLNRTGQLALTFYVAHVVLGMGLVDAFGNKAFGAYSLEFSVAYALIFSLLCIVFAIFWTRRKSMGPVEWLMRKLTG